jgi:quinol monooxygenase YgiN
VTPTDQDNLFTVTTRSRLRGPWFFPQMMLASLRVRHQLKRDTEVVRWASIIAGPSEFWTITVWKSRHDMQEFVRSDAHDDIMWLFSKWLRSFWLMRWRPGPNETGEWKGMTMARADPDQPGDTGRLAANGHGTGDGDGNGIGEGTGGNGGRRTGVAAARDALLDRALEHLPKLKQAMAPDGTIGYDTTVFARRRRAEVGGAGGAVIHIHTDPTRTPFAYRDLRALRKECEGDDGMLRAVVGVSRPGDVYLLSVWRDRDGVQRLLTSPQARKLAERWPGYWANEWIPENEFGHWDGLRLRRARTRYSIKVPQAALDVAEPSAS